MYTLHSMQHLALVIRKTEPVTWRRLFAGDSDHVRYAGPPPYGVAYLEVPHRPLDPTPSTLYH